MGSHVRVAVLGTTLLTLDWGPKDNQQNLSLCDIERGCKIDVVALWLQSLPDQTPPPTHHLYRYNF